MPTLKLLPPNGLVSRRNQVVWVISTARPDSKQHQQLQARMNRARRVLRVVAATHECGMLEALCAVLERQPVAKMIEQGAI